MSIRVYRYGLLPPTEGVAQVDGQIRLAHRYQNALIEIERSRRAATTAVLEQHDTTAPLRLALDAAVSDLAAALSAAAAERGATRRRALSPVTREALSTARSAVKGARAALREATRAARTDPAIMVALDDVARQHKVRAKAARAACGVYWGTYLLIEAAVDATRRHPAMPRFQRWTGDGAVGVQIQHGLDATTLIGGTDARIQITGEASPVPGRGGRSLPRLRLRVGSTETRDPIWAEWPIILHRPIPPSRLKQASVHRARVAGRDVWSLHLTLDLGEALTEPCGTGVVAVDLGWRQVDGQIRAGGWTDGTTSEDIWLDPAVRGQLQKAEDLRSIRDKALPPIREALLAWRGAQDVLPEAHQERLRHLPSWRSPARFAALAIWWRTARVPGDEVILSALEAWRRQDRHLWLWETHARRRALARRREQYRQLACRLARRYGMLVIERLALDRLARIPAPDDTQENVPQGRSQRVEAAPASLRSALVHAMQSRGGQVVTVPPMGPAQALLEAWRERRDVAEVPVIARVPKFGRIKTMQAERASVQPEATPE